MSFRRFTSPPPATSQLRRMFSRAEFHYFRRHAASDLRRFRRRQAGHIFAAITPRQILRRQADY